MSDQRMLAALLRPIARRLSMMLARGTVALSTATTKMQGLQMRLLAGEVKDGMEHFEAYGFTSNPHVGAEGIAAFFDGDRSHGVVLCVADRRYRLRALESGEVALHDDQGQKVHLTRTGIVIESPLKIRFAAPVIELHATTSYKFDVNGQGQKWDGLGVETWQDNDIAKPHHNHAPPEIP